MAKWRASRIVGKAEVRLSTETIMVGGSAQRCVADRPSSPAGPLAERAVTIVLPVARWPIACQNCFMSTAGFTTIMFTASGPNGPRHSADAKVGANASGAQDQICIRMHRINANVLGRRKDLKLSYVLTPA